VIAVGGTDDAGPWKFDAEVTGNAIAVDFVAVFVYQYGLNAG